MNTKSFLRVLLPLQGAVIIYSLSSVAGKFASNYDFLSFKFILCYGIEIFLLGVYAIIWQQILKKNEVSVAYANKATAIFWSLVFAVLFFNESIRINHIVGVIIIFIGILLVNKNG